MTNNGANVTSVTPQDVDGVLNEHLQPEDEVLLAVRQHCRAQGLPDIEVSAQQGKMLELLARTARAQNVLEIGTLGGYSTICLARGMNIYGHLTTLEYEDHHATVAYDNLVTAGVNHLVDIRVGDAHEILPTFAGGPGQRLFDFVFIDADKESNEAYFKWADTLGTPDVTIIVDNVIRDGRVLDPARKDKLDFIKFLGSHYGFETSVVQTVGAKGWDGFVIAKRVRR